MCVCSVKIKKMYVARADSEGGLLLAGLEGCDLGGVRYKRRIVRHLLDGGEHRKNHREVGNDGLTKRNDVSITLEHQSFTQILISG